MFNTHPHYKYIRQKPSCSTLPKAEPIHKSPAIDSARRRLHTTSSAHELLQVGTQGRSYSAKHTKAHRFQQVLHPQISTVSLVRIQKVTPSSATLLEGMDHIL